MNRIHWRNLWLAFLITTVVALTTIGVGVMFDKANAAAPTTDCISNHEYVTMPQVGLTMSELQAWFDATGKVVHTQYHGTSVIKQYPWCGLYESQGFVQIHYDYLTMHGMSGYYADVALQYDFRDPLAHQPARDTQWGG